MRKYDDDTEYAVGEKFLFRDTILQVVEVKENKCIYPCYFRLNARCVPLDLLCAKEERDDGKSVMFVEVGKTGKVEDGPVDMDALKNTERQLDMFNTPENSEPLKITVKE